jgi:hypothetical protein
VISPKAARLGVLSSLLPLFALFLQDNMLVKLCRVEYCTVV